MSYRIGHIPRQVAAKLAPFLDRASLHVEGELAGGIGPFDCPLLVYVYGPDTRSEEGVVLLAELKAAKLPLDTFKAAEQAEKKREKDEREAAKRREMEEKRRLAEARRVAAGTGNGVRFDASNEHGFANTTQAGLDSQPVMADILEASQRFNPREIGQATDQYGVKEEALKNMPLASKPAAIKTQMLPHQLQALKWLFNKENPSLPPVGSTESVQLWSREARDSSRFTNLATRFSTDEPKLASGGILADDMGLGKTLEMIALIVADAEKAGRRTGPTLVCCPLSVISNWRTQCEQHVHASSSLKVYTYHGNGRGNMTRADFDKYDVVITTYGTLSSEFHPKGKASHSAPRERHLRSSGLYCMDWRRVILDEGHNIRNPASKGAAAVTALTARSRWVLTGTPIVNGLKDLYSLLRFVGITGGLETLEIFNRVLVRPLKSGDPSAVFLLQAIMTALTLRRRKEMSFVDLRLPKLDEYIHRIDFTQKERERYDALYMEAQGLLTRYEAKSGGQNFQHLLEVLLRMRQCCNHWQLCGERVTALLAQLAEQKHIDLTPENKKALQDLLRMHIQNQEECSICLEMLHEPVITTCGHFFGNECISKVIELQKKCPMCRAELKDESCLVAPANDGGDEIADEDMDLTQSSSKLEMTMQILGATKTEGTKTVIFSQWTRYLDIVQARLDRDGYKYCRIDGTMPAPKRDAALEALDQDPECTIMLASLGVCAVGLNLTAANQVVLSDTWWAPAIEDQAVDRIHRLGQTRETRVFRLVMDKSIEDRTLDVQKEKRALAAAAFGEKDGKRQGPAKAGRLADIQKLLRPAKKE